MPRFGSVCFRLQVKTGISSGGSFRKSYSHSLGQCIRIALSKAFTRLWALCGVSSGTSVMNPDFYSVKKKDYDKVQ